MGFLQKAFKYLKNPRKIILLVNSKGLGWLFSDKFIVKCAYKEYTGKKLDLKNPQTFNEKLQWLKLYNRKSEYTAMVDKYEAKKLVAEQIGEEYVIPTLGVWDKFDDIDFDDLPDQFVLKTTHDSGGLIICKDKSKLDKQAAKNKLQKSLKRNYFWYLREWPYKNVKPRIIAEKFMKDSFHPDEPSLLVYKIMCFHGQPKIIQAIQGDKTKEESIDYFDCDWNRLSLRQNFPNSKNPLAKPQSLEEMLAFAAKMSKGVPFLRVDFYEIEQKPYFSEFTFFSDAGIAKFEPEEWDYTLGSWIELPNRNGKINK